jgi:hypothetical protein
LSQITAAKVKETFTFEALDHCWVVSGSHVLLSAHAELLFARHWQHGRQQGFLCINVTFRIQSSSMQGWIYLIYSENKMICISNQLEDLLAPQITIV